VRLANGAALRALVWQHVLGGLLESSAVPVASRSQSDPRPTE